MRKFTAVLSLAPVALLAACGGGGSPAPTATPTPTPVATGGGGGQTTFAYDVEPCYTQIVPGTGGLSVRQLIVPDTLKLAGLVLALIASLLLAIEPDAADEGGEISASSPTSTVTM